MSTNTDVDTALPRLDDMTLDEIDVTDTRGYAHLWNHCLDRDRAPEEGVAAFSNYV